MNHTSFKDFGAFTESIQDADMRFTMPSLDRPIWAIGELSLGPLHIQAGFEGSGNIAEGATTQDGLVLYLQRSGSWARANGVRLCPKCVFVIEPGAEFCIASPDAHDWVSLFIQSGVLQPAGPGKREDSQVRHIISPTVGRLDYILEQLLSPSVTQSSVLNKPASFAAIASDLTSVCRTLLAESCDTKPKPMGRPQQSREELVALAVSLIDGNPQPAQTVQDLAVATSVSERTLRNVFLEYFGVSPMKYMELRRLHQARNLLVDGSRQDVTVADIAGSLGFWDFGRFSGRYHKLFGEFPSATLKYHRRAF